MSLAEHYSIDLSYEHKTACPKCRAKGNDTAGNNLHVYGEDNGAYCWACEFTIPSEAHKEKMGWTDNDYDEGVMSTRERITEEENQRIKSITSVDGSDWRGIRKETNKFFGVRYEYDEETGEPCAQYVPTTVEGKLAGYRVRKFPKDFSQPIGKVGKECDMIGEWKFKNYTRTCLIVGGETKVLNAYQMLKDDKDRRGKEDLESVAVVCSTLGESGAHKQVQSRYEFFNQFQKIVVCMDADEAGEEAARRVCKVLPKGKAYVMKMRFKDADDYVEAGRQKDFITDFWNAKPYTPDGIVASTSLPEKTRIAAALEKIGLPPFMHELESKMAGGIPLKVIVNLGSASGTGKSTIIDECVYHWIFHSPYKVGIVTLESDSGQYAIKLLSRHVGRKIDLIEDIEEKMNYLDSDFIKGKEHELYYNEDGSARFYLIEERDGGLESLQNLIMELIIACDCQLIILDPLQDILDGLTNEEQSVFMRWMKGMVKSHDVTFINVNHVRKSQGGKTANSAGAEMFEEDMQGSSSIFKSGACNLLFSRNKEAEDPIERNTTVMKASKIRWTGKTGIAGRYYYDIETHTMHDLNDWLAAQLPVDFENPSGEHVDPETGEITKEKKRIGKARSK